MVWILLFLLIFWDCFFGSDKYEVKGRKTDWGFFLFWIVVVMVIALADFWFWHLPKIIAVLCIGLFIFWESFVKWCVRKHNAKTN